MNTLKVMNKNRINILNLEKIIGLIAIFLLPIDSLYITFLPIEISLFRIVIILFFIIYIIFLFRIKKNIYTFLLLLYSISCLLSFILSENKNLSVSILLNDIFSIIYIYIALDIYDCSDIPLLLKAIIYSMIFPFIFSIMEYFNFFVIGQRITSISLFGFLQSSISAEEISLQQISGIPRLVFPYSISPIFSLNVGVGILSLMLLESFNSKIKYKNTILLFLVLLMILSFSRSGLFALAISYIIYVIKFKKISSRKIISFCVFIYIILCVFLFVLPKWNEIFLWLDSNSEIFHILIGRVDESSLSSILESRHFLLILEGLNILFKNAKNLLIGIGTQSIILTYGEYTFIPYSFLSSHITILVERGLLGYLGTFMIYFYPLLKKRLRSSPIVCLLLYILISMFLYEMRSSLIIPIVTSICLIYVSKYKRV